jgi:hypothetical protein
MSILKKHVKLNNLIEDFFKHCVISRIVGLFS